ncbi:hypothetical protein LWI29_023283 [Acer saccharum]|uniref:Uncharacterized protein n=1 Tax=Acer saccharum TaxID=4024 RepID=A0AA39RDJ6_ACESA|nr:hypothetical protein LWI29_023283 [Acer saccharum]
MLSSNEHEETLKGVKNNRFSDMQNLDNMHDVQVEILDTTQIPPKSAAAGISVSGGVGSESLKTNKMGGNGDVYGSNDKGPKAVERVERSDADTCVSWLPQLSFLEQVPVTHAHSRSALASHESPTTTSLSSSRARAAPSTTVSSPTPDFVTPQLPAPAGRPFPPVPT